MSKSNISGYQTHPPIYIGNPINEISNCECFKCCLCLFTDKMEGQTKRVIQAFLAKLVWQPLHLTKKSELLIRHTTFSVLALQALISLLDIDCLFQMKILTGVGTKCFPFVS